MKKHGAGSRLMTGLHVQPSPRHCRVKGLAPGPGSCFPLALACLFVLAALAGCGLTSATAIQYASPAPPEKTCTLNIAGTLTITTFDNQDVHWTAGFGDMWAQVKIAEGSHSFVFDYDYPGEAGTLSRYTATGLSVSYDGFRAGHSYLLTAQPLSAGARRLSARVGIKDVTNEPDWGSLSKAFTWTDGFEWLPVAKAP